MDYFKELALSQSGIPALRRSPAHFLYHFEHEKKQTPQMKRGSLVDVLFYTPDDFPSLYAVYEGPTSGKGSKTEKDAFAEKCEAEGKDLVMPKDLEEAMRIVQFLRSNKVIQRLTAGASFQVELILTHPTHGVPVKAKFDSISDEFITDLKTTTASADVWTKRAMDSKAYIQAAWYRRMAKLMDGKERSFAYKVIDVNPPYEIFIVEPESDLLKLADRHCDEALRIFEKCFKEQKWPHGKTKYISWALPNYLKGELDDKRI